MTDTVEKRAEREVCARLGGSRRGPAGEPCSDCVEVEEFAVEVFCRARPTFDQRKLGQAREHSKREGKPWLLVQRVRSREGFIASLDFGGLVELLEDARCARRARRALEVTSDGMTGDAYHAVRAALGGKADAVGVLLDRVNDEGRYVPGQMLLGEAE